MSGFTVSGLTTYVRDNADDIQVAAITGAETLTYPGISIQAGIKNADRVMLFANSAPFQQGTCAFNASGSSTFTERTLTVTKLKWQDTFCPEDLENKYLSTKLIAGSNYDAMPFEKLIVDSVTANINFQMEQAIWQGDTTLTNNVTLKQFDGWLKTIDAASPTYATATANITAANVIGIFDDVYKNVPTALLNHPTKKLVAFCGWDTFRLLIIAIKDLNAFHYDAGAAAKTGEITLPGSGLSVKAVHGLDTISGALASYADRIVCTWPGNLFFGTDLESDKGDARFHYSADDQNVKGSIKWKAGCQIAYGSEIVTYKNS